MENIQDITPKAIGSVKWSALQEVITRTASPIILVVLAKLLVPEDFGIIATATIVISFAKMFWQVGLGQALIQTDETPKKAANVVFWSNLILGVTIYLILYLAAPWFAAFFNSPKSEAILRILGLKVVIGSLTSVQLSLFIRNFQFKEIFLVKLMTAFLPGLFSIPMAYFGYGVWALVAGSMVESIFALVLFWSKSSWRPTFTFDFAIWKNIYGFAIWVFAESLLIWFVNWGDSLIVGRYLGVGDLGVYRLGWSMSTIVFGLFLNPFLPVIYPTLSRLQNNKKDMVAAFNKINRVVLLFALPLGTGLLLVSHEIVGLFFGDKWSGLGLVFGVLSFRHGISWLVGINAAMYRAIGRPDLSTKILFTCAIIYLPAYLLAAPLGIDIFTYTRLSVTFLSIPIHIFATVKLLNLSYFYLWHQGKNIFLSTLSMAVLTMMFDLMFSNFLSSFPIIIELIILIIFGVIAYVGTLWFIDRSFVDQMKDLIRRVTLPNKIREI